MKSFRLFSTISSVTVIPSGLKLIPNFLPELTAQVWACDLDKEITRLAADLPIERATTYLSKQHNLKSNESFKKISLETFDRSKILQCQHFERYGEEGHTLTYFIGNKNVPSFVNSNLIKSLENLVEVEQLKSKKHRETGSSALDWNFTFNVYRNSASSPSVIPGFPFHTDIPSNGEITFIYPIISSAILEMKRELPELHQQLQHSVSSSNEVCTYNTELPAGALLMFSGESRWEWQHRILPQHTPSPSTAPREPGAIWRISLVLGCR